jgi:hypothetical protein
MLIAAAALWSRSANATVIAGGSIAGNTLWTVANNPYIVQGDVTIVAGATLTIQPGVIVQFASADSQAAGVDTSRVELTVQGTLDASGTAAFPITFAPQTGSGTSIWYGIVAGSSTAGVTLSHVAVSGAVDGVSSAAPGALLSVSSSAFNNCSTGVALTDGNPTLRGLTIDGGSIGVNVTINASATIRESVIQNMDTYGVYAWPIAPTSTVSILNTVLRNDVYGALLSSGGGNLSVSVVNSTIHQNSYMGIYAQPSGGGTTQLAVTNSIVTQNAHFGVYAVAGTTVTWTYSDVWNNGTDYFNVVPGVGSLAVDPRYTSPPSDLTLQAASPCIDSGTPVSLTTDLVGAARPSNGDGINGAAYDMGAYERPAPVNPAAVPALGHRAVFAFAGLLLSLGAFATGYRPRRRQRAALRGTRR